MPCSTFSGAAAVPGAAAASGFAVVFNVGAELWATDGVAAGVSARAVAAGSSGDSSGGAGFAVVSVSGTVCTSLIGPEYSIAGRLANSAPAESHFGPIAL